MQVNRDLNILFWCLHQAKANKHAALRLMRFFRDEIFPHQFRSLTLICVCLLAASCCCCSPVCVWLTLLNPRCNGKQIMACAAWWVEEGIISMFIHLCEKMCVCVCVCSHSFSSVLPFVGCLLYMCVFVCAFVCVQLMSTCPNVVDAVQKSGCVSLCNELLICIHESLLEASPLESSFFSLEVICHWL